MKKALFARLLALVLTLTLAVGAVPAAAEDAVVTIGVTGSLATLNPIAMDATEVVKYATSLVFLPLVELDRDLNFAPQLAESITTEDNLLFTIRLNPKATWSDGTPVTADDVLFTLTTYASPESTNIALMLYNVVGVKDDGTIESGADSIEGVKAVDEHTVTIQMKKPMALYTFENNFGRYLLTLPKHVLADTPKGELLKSTWFAKPDVISGPYFIQDYDLNHYVHFVANDKYFLGAPKIKYLNMNIVAPSQMLAGLQSGEIDLVQQTMGAIPMEDYDAVRALPNITAVNGKPVTNEATFINTQRVTDVRIRQALLCGLDRATVLTELAHGNGELMEGFLTSASPFYSQELGTVAYDPAKAAALIAEAKADGVSTELTWYVNSSEATWVQAVEFFSAMMAEIGLTINIKTVDLATLMATATAGGHDLLSVAYTIAPVDPYTDISWLLGGEGSWTGYTSEAIQTAMAESQSTTDMEAIRQAYLTVNREMVDQVPMFAGYAQSTLGAVSNRLVHATPDAYGTLINVQDWEVR